MNNIIKVGDKDYPFHFGMRVVWYMSNSGEIEFDEVEGKIQSDYDAFLDLFIIANKSALERSSSEAIPLTRKQLEFAIDDNPKLLKELQDAFVSSKVIEKMNEVEDEKKPTG